MFNHTPQPYAPTLFQKNFRGKRWYETETGERYPSITTVLACEEKPALEAWKRAMGSKRAAKEAERCSRRGTLVHGIIEQYLSNNPDHLKDHEYDFVKLFNRIKMHLNKIDNIRCLEQYLFSKRLGIAGCVDCVAEYNGVLSVIDFKTANGAKHETDIQDYFLQCTAYAIMYGELYNDCIEDIVVIITPEKSNTMPMVFKRKIDDYVAPLLQRIAKYNGMHNG